MNGNDVLHALFLQFEFYNKSAKERNHFLRWTKETHGYDSFEYKIANEYVNFPPISERQWKYGTGEDF